MFHVNRHSLKVQACLFCCALITACEGTDELHNSLLGGGAPCGTSDGGVSGGDGGGGGGGTTGDNLVLNGDFTSDFNDWTPNIHTGMGTISIATVTDISPPITGGKVVKIVNPISQEAYKLQIYQDDLPIEKGYCYKVSFYAKAQLAKKFAVGLGKQTPDWRSYGLWVEPRLTFDWKEYVYTFTATEKADDARLSLNFGTANTTIFLDDVALEEIATTPCP